MDDDSSWLKNPILPRPPAVPRFSAAELRLVEDERPSSIIRVRNKQPEAKGGPRKRRAPRVSGTSTVKHESVEGLVPARSRRLG